MSRRQAMEEFVSHYRGEIATYEDSIRMMKAGQLGLWAMENGQRVYQTAATIAKDEEIVRRLTVQLERIDRSLAAGEYD